MRSCVSSFFLLVLFLLFSTIVYFTHAARFDIKNNCPYTVWAAATPGGGKKLNTYDVWAIDMKPGTNGRIWARTGCSFNEAGIGTCETGDCGGVLECEGSGGQPPNTLAEFSLDTANKDFFDISLVDGFNVPIDFSSTSTQCTRSIECVADINNECTAELKVKTGSVGCNNPCTVFQTDEYCCMSGPDNCKPTNFSRFFKTRCPDAYVYSYDDRRSSTFTCPTGTNYSVVFCPDIKQKGVGLLKLHDDVQMCGYEDVQVMWEILQRTESKMLGSKNNNHHDHHNDNGQPKHKHRLFPKVFVWSNQTTNHQ